MTRTSDQAVDGKGDRELEWQLISPDLNAVHRWLVEHHTLQGMLVEHRPPLQIHDTYFDTDDWRVQRAGFALRVRSAEGMIEATLKELSPPKQGIADRRELTDPLADATADAVVDSAGPVGTRVQALVGGHALHALFSVGTLRQRFAVRMQDGTEDLGEIALDETVVARPDGVRQTSLSRVEVEALTRKCEPLHRLVKMLSTQCTLEPAMDSKYTVGLRAVGLTPPDATVFVSHQVDGLTRVEEIAIATLRRQLSTWIAREPGARLGENPEELHDMRLAGRRIDATLALFASHLPAALVRTRLRLKMILRALGNVRDLDVQLARLNTFQRALPAADRAAMLPLTSLLDAERSRARTRLLRILDAPQTEKWLTRLRAALLEPAALRARHDQETITLAAPSLVGSRHKKLRKAVRSLTAKSTMEDYHGVRGRIKKFRYAIEPIAAIYGKPADALLRSLRRLQDQLGEQQDAHVTLSHLQTLVRETKAGLPPEAVFLMGRMAESHLATTARRRDEFHRCYPKLRKRWKQLRRRFEQLNTQLNGPKVSTSRPQLPAM